MATARAISVLPQPGRPVEQHPFGRVDAQALEHLRVLQGKLDHLPDSVQLFPQAADVFIGNLVAAGPGFGLLLNLDLGAGMDQHHSLRDGADNGEVLAARAEEIGPYRIPFHQGQAVQQSADIPGVPLPAHRPHQGQGIQDYLFSRQKGGLLHGDFFIQGDLGIAPQKARPSG